MTRYARNWKKGTAVAVEETQVERNGEMIPATFMSPASHKGELPAWIILGGITSMGRFHPQLIRFARALAASGAGVMVPEIPEWRDLKLAPEMTTPTVRGALRALEARPEVQKCKVGLVGFSFGAAQAAIASSYEDLSRRIAGVVLFGGYCDLERTLRYQLTGLHEWDGVTERVDPDPYGRWVIASNYLTLVPGYEDATEVCAALRRLALASTELRIPAWDPRHDALKAELRSNLMSRHQTTFDLFAPCTTATTLGGDAGEAMAIDLARACRKSQPLLDPNIELERMRVPIHLFHGRGDRLVPYTESLRFHQRLPTNIRSDVTVTGLFAHSADHRPATMALRVREGLVFFKAMQGVLNWVG